MRDPMTPAARAELLAWYDRTRRDLPWRRHPTPWAVWVSEVMLQQTRVGVVEPYFVRFLERFPKPEALAAAGEEEVLALWSGLGYYRRARQLVAGARAVAAAGGSLPRRAEELEKLPGIGPYTAAAIAAIAFGEPVAVLDGNVARVMARLGALAGDPARAGERRRLRAEAEHWIDPARPGDSNQALMELGATLCLPRAPHCEACPVAGACAARARGEQNAFPPPRRRIRPERVRRVAALVSNDRGELLLVRRDEAEGQLAGLWEMPTVDAAGRRQGERALAARYGGTWRLEEPAASVRHTITRHAIEVVAWRAHRLGDELRETAAEGWFNGAGELALTAATRKLFAALAEQPRPASVGS